MMRNGDFYVEEWGGGEGIGNYLQKGVGERIMIWEGRIKEMGQKAKREFNIENDNKEVNR